MYNYYCPENKDKNVPNGKCVVTEITGQSDSYFYKSRYDIDLERYSLKTEFNKNNIITIDHCNNDSIKSKYCDAIINTPCKSNNDCFSNSCNDNQYCLDSKDFYISIVVVIF